ARVALDLYRDLPNVSTALDRLAERIRAAHEARLATPYVKPAPLRLALAALGLGAEESNPFRQPGPSSSVALSPGQLAAPRRPVGGGVPGVIPSCAVAAA